MQPPGAGPDKGRTRQCAERMAEQTLGPARCEGMAAHPIALRLTPRPRQPHRGSPVGRLDPGASWGSRNARTCHLGVDVTILTAAPAAGRGQPSEHIGQDMALERRSNRFLGAGA